MLDKSENKLCFSLIQCLFYELKSKISIKYSESSSLVIRLLSGFQQFKKFTDKGKLKYCVFW